ncbi:hypothetical protein SDC9_64253 [bioreactor metagenome]|uniref:D-isomer specific 2-hydroxyacid dehydrogenase catalytic domain-containing protein n=1 Tax=bioreactor metagenome TaxID=1076179 RepID=A0A644XUQ4_9ZZZZ
MGKYKIKTLNGISESGLEKFGQNFEVGEKMDAPHGIILRSASLHEMEFPDSLHCIARAGAGVNNIPVDKCAEKGIVVFNTPGANANAVRNSQLLPCFCRRERLWKGLTGHGR